MVASSTLDSRGDKVPQSASCQERSIQATWMARDIDINRIFADIPIFQVALELPPATWVLALVDLSPPFPLVPHRMLTIPSSELA